ncbi:N-acetylmuramoyl-L-alanine amidase [Salirhabdus sp. Marseille-P4669]|uniref:N-acetylmuramoyl-L-alanine amidase n=1 Tax=Salirhabdus sp. Marseille-P4669 TaxID=2042310 RepID=UPI000C7D17F4|nr:N-acetylmuramoyl-L-alanine amidase [Salirhabdus sp. Marseille-P4669]
MKKKILYIPSLSFLLLLLFNSPVFAVDGTITVDNLNIRSGPGTEYDVVGQAHKNTSVTILDQTGTWYKIKLGQTEGWVSQEFVTVAQSGNKLDAYVIIDAKDVTVQVREEPHMNGKVMDQLKGQQSYPFLEEKNSWYKIQLPSGNTGWVAKWLVEKIDTVSNNKDQPQEEKDLLKNKVIIIDAGHGGDDTGTISVTGDYEKYLTFRTSDLLAEKLERLGAIPIQTRTTDYFLTLENRVAFSHAYQADAFISIHYNSAPEFPEVHGIGTFYYHDQYYPLANEIQKEVIKATGLKNREARFGDYFVVRENIRPSVLLELGFLSNQTEENIVKGDQFQQQATNGIIRGLIQYFDYIE